MLKASKENVAFETRRVAEAGNAKNQVPQLTNDWIYGERGGVVKQSVRVDYKDRDYGRRNYSRIHAAGYDVCAQLHSDKLGISYHLCLSCYAREGGDSPSET